MTMGSSGDQLRMFEDFNPTSEWQQDAQSHYLILPLPGFKKEQIKVSTEGQNIIRVRGERPVGGNKWSRFSQDFEVPQNSDMNSTRARFHQGVLSIHVPKKIADKPPPAADIPNRNHQDQADNTTKDGGDDAERNHISPLKEKNATEGGKELGQLKKANFEANKELNEKRVRFFGSVIENAVKGLGEMNEERQLMVNMGAAVLVIMALSAYVTYKFVAAAEDKK